VCTAVVYPFILTAFGPVRRVKSCGSPSRTFLAGGDRLAAGAVAGGGARTGSGLGGGADAYGGGGRLDGGRGSYAFTPG
jgi:hypothetical protein